MSLIHDALKKAEGEKETTTPRIPPITNPIVADRKKPLTKIFLYSGLLLVSAILLVYFRFIKKPSAPDAPKPIGTVQKASPDSSTASAQKEKALKLFQEGKLKESLAIWGELTLSDPTDPEVYNNMGFIYKKLGKTDEAYQAYDKALALKKNYAEALNNLGVLLLQQKQTKQAKEKLELAILNKPDYAEPYFNYALILEREGNFKEAQRYYQDFLKRPSPLEPELKKRIEERIKLLERR